MMMSELYCVGDLCRACGFCHNGVAAVLLKCYTHIPTHYTAKVPRIPRPLLGGLNKEGRSRGTGHDPTSLEHQKGEGRIAVNVVWF